MENQTSITREAFTNSVSKSEEAGKASKVISARPFLKWVGGKRSILSTLQSRIPENYTHYYEPFLGGGALFFGGQPTKAALSDIDTHLITAFLAVRDNVADVIKVLKIHARHHNKAYYLKLRKTFSTEPDPIKKAALLIYLNKTCYNGLHRVNLKGEFNVPMGSYENPTILDETNLHHASRSLQKTTIKQQSFSKIRPKNGAFYYLDPPYHKKYNAYSAGGFGDEQHKTLANLCHAIHNAGGYFMLSNSDTTFIRKLYEKFKIENIMAGRSVSCKSHQRGRYNELLIRNYG